VKIEIAGEELHLLAHKAIWLPKRKTVLISDLHFGKINHFRKSGIPVPQKANEKNTESLIDILNLYKPRQTIFLGDLFHSHYNDEWEVIGQIIKHFSSCRFELVRGNHDIMSQRQYERHKIDVHESSLSLGNLLLTHEPMLEIPTGTYNLAGHIHPGIRLVGKARQSITLPCFYFGQQQGILPAFGSFTGLARITPKSEDRIFVIVDNKIQQL